MRPRLVTILGGLIYLMVLTTWAIWSVTVAIQHHLVSPADRRPFFDRYFVSFEDGRLWLLYRIPAPDDGVIFRSGEEKTTDYIMSVHDGVIAVVLVPPFAYTAVAWVRRKRAPEGTCTVCGYDLRATPSRCPECGTDANSNPCQRTIREFRTDRVPPTSS